MPIKPAIYLLFVGFLFQLIGGAGEACAAGVSVRITLEEGIPQILERLRRERNSPVLSDFREFLEEHRRVLERKYAPDEAARIVRQMATNSVLIVDGAVYLSDPSMSLSIEILEEPHRLSISFL